ncbi:hypothetical protein ACFQ3W_08110 [Paenibacillus puldeungensis]|uniref:DUF2726 domain-containing protein n=1 Tax=Paenibacillus puldeungensis TaxID=696536 RepID=A0ABW3RWM1_9BACL
MGAYSDGLLMLLIAGIAAYLLYRGFRSWVRKPLTLRSRIRYQLNTDILDHPAVELLEQAGYEVISDRLKVPLSFQVNRDVLYSRLFIDYIAVRNGEFYLVKTARERLAIDWTGSGVRRELLPYLLLYPDSAGVLYIDAEQGMIKKICMIVDDNEDEDDTALEGYGG